MKYQLRCKYEDDRLESACFYSGGRLVGMVHRVGRSWAHWVQRDLWDSSHDVMDEVFTAREFLTLHGDDPDARALLVGQLQRCSK